MASYHRTVRFLNASRKRQWLRRGLTAAAIVFLAALAYGLQTERQRTALAEEKTRLAEQGLALAQRETEVVRGQVDLAQQRVVAADESLATLQSQYAASGSASDEERARLAREIQTAQASKDAAETAAAEAEDQLRGRENAAQVAVTQQGLAESTATGLQQQLDDADAQLDEANTRIAELEMALAAAANATLTAGDLRVAPATGMRFRYIPAGQFVMGSPTGEAGRDVDETRHRVTLSRGYWIGETEVTQGQWTQLMENNPSRYKDCGDDCPVEQVSWYDAVEFVNALSEAGSLEQCYKVDGREVQFEGLDCEGFRLPTEAEWERAARADTQSIWYFGGDRVDLAEHAWFSDNGQVSTHPVGERAESPWGLRDVYGNVWEWCFDWYGPFSEQSETDPIGPTTSTISARVLRGGAFDSDARALRGADRLDHSPETGRYYSGLRVVWSSAGGPD